MVILVEGSLCIPGHVSRTCSCVSIFSVISKSSVGSFSVTGRLALSLSGSVEPFPVLSRAPNAPCYRRNPH